MLGRRNRRGCEPRDVALHGDLFLTFSVMWSTDDLTTVLSVWTETTGRAAATWVHAQRAATSDVRWHTCDPRAASACPPPRATRLPRLPMTHVLTAATELGARRRTMSSTSNDSANALCPAKCPIVGIEPKALPPTENACRLVYSRVSVLSRVETRVIDISWMHVFKSIITFPTPPRHSHLLLYGCTRLSRFCRFARRRSRRGDWTLTLERHACSAARPLTPQRSDRPTITTR